jgi:hypothetical protein
MLRRAGCHVLCLGPGAPVLALLAHMAGAGRATAVVDNSLAYQVPRELLSATVV